MNKGFYVYILLGFLISTKAFTQTSVPNGDFESWVDHSSYQDPLYWDTPNQEVAPIPFIGVTVVSRSTDYESGAYSVKLETRHLSVPPLYIPGFITLGNLTINLTSGSFIITKGAPITDNPTHLMGYYKFMPQGGDSCLVAIGLFKTHGGVRDTIGTGVFSTKSTVTDWTPFSAWIDYTLTGAPDTMNIFALSTAQETNMHVGTVLYLDNITLDYTVGVNGQKSKKEIDVYQDKETHRLLTFFNFDEPQITSVGLYNMMGKKVKEVKEVMIQKERKVFSYDDLPRGIYLLEILHSSQKYCKKFFFNF
jgi:hypothetical protein